MQLWLAVTLVYQWRNTAWHKEMHGRRCSKLKFANLGELISTARLKLTSGSSWTSSDTLFSFFLVSYPDCIDSESRCPFDWLCFLLEIQVASITGRFYLTQSFYYFTTNKIAFLHVSVRQGRFRINFWLCQRIFGFVFNSAVARVCSRIFYVC